MKPINPCPSRYNLLFFLSFTLSPSSGNSQCSASGILHAGTVVNDNSIGALAFSNPGNGTTADNNPASANVVIGLLSGSTYYLKATGFGFTIPSTYAICGVEVSVKKKAAGLGIGAWIQDNSVRLVKAGSITGSDLANTGVDWSGSSAYFTYGGTSQLWGLTLTPADVNDPNFGVVISAKFNGLAIVLPSAQVDDIEMKLYFNIPLPVRVVSFNGILKERTAELNWQTAGEEDNESITLQRQGPGQLQWTDISTNKMHLGNDNTRYSYNDLLSVKGNYSYRLEIKGVSGQLTYSEIKTIHFDGHVSLSVYPNPAARFITIDGLMNTSMISITNQYGQSIRSQAVDAGSTRAVIDIQSLPRGFYFARIGSERLKFIKQ